MDFARGISEAMFCWVIAVQLPVLAFTLGASATLGAKWVLFGFIAMFIGVEVLRAGPFWIAVGLGLYFLTKNPWFSCFCLSLGFVSAIESSSVFTHIERQVNDLVADLLGEQVKYSIKPVEIPPLILQGFPSYSSLKLRLQRYRRFTKTVGIEVPSHPEPIRVFSYEPSDSQKITSAAAAFAMMKYPSLVFMRVPFEDLNSAQRLQLYHELAHGTPEGARILLRPIRWQVVQPLALVMSMLLFALCLLAVITKPHDHGAWYAVASLLFGSSFRKLAIDWIKRMADGPSEVLADSIALGHPEFSEGGMWRVRAENLARRLDDQLHYMAHDDEKRFAVNFRMNWLRRWLSIGQLRPYITSDVDPRLLLSLWFYAVAGYTANFPLHISGYIFWPVLALAFAANIRMAFNGMRSNELIEALENRINSRLPK